MPKNPQEFADLLGAKIVGEVPDVDCGPFGTARLAYIMHQRQPASQVEASHLVVLIDAENADARRIESILNEVAQHGTASVKRAYGDWTTPALTPWKDKLNRFAIQPIQQFRYTCGKNVSDSALIIDAMDLLHSGRFDAFCLVSSDSDFTRLACRLRESGVTVYGFGESKTPDPFVQACDRFVVVGEPTPAKEETAAEPEGLPETTTPLEPATLDSPAGPVLGMARYEDIRRLCGRLIKECFDLRKKIGRGVPPAGTQIEKFLAMCAEAATVCGNLG